MVCFYFMKKNIFSITDSYKLFAKIYFQIKIYNKTACFCLKFVFRYFLYKIHKKNQKIVPADDRLLRRNFNLYNKKK